MILGRNKALLSIKDNFWQCNESLCVLSKCSGFYNIIIYLPYYTSSKQQNRNHTTYSRILISSLTPVQSQSPLYYRNCKLCWLTASQAKRAMYLFRSLPSLKYNITMSRQNSTVSDHQYQILLVRVPQF